MKHAPGNSSDKLYLGHHYGIIDFARDEISDFDGKIVHTKNGK